MLSFEKFKEEVKLHFLEYCPQDYQMRDVHIVRNFKENQVLDGIALSSKENQTAPVLYLKVYYEDMCEMNLSIETILKRLAVDYQRAENMMPVMEMPNIQSREWILKNLYTQAINYEQNQELLQTVPHIQINDLAIIPRVNIGKYSTIKITHDICEISGLDGDLIVAMAMQNNTKISKPVFGSMNDMLNESFLTEYPEDVLMPLYVLSNEEKHYGASMIADKQVLDSVAKSVGEEFYILPSSVHEIIIAPKSMWISPEELRQMVVEINRTILQPEEFLSDNIYQYDARKHELQMYSPAKGKMEREKVKVPDNKDMKKSNRGQRKPKNSR
ncbi:MAG: hypothetical protein H2212_03530 [Ruminococcus sp.]|nr:hypothetical protein [Ruminococcus sp.]